MKAFLPGAYVQAMRLGRLASLVHCERGAGKEDGAVWLWLAHPKDGKYGKLREYRTKPRAYTYEVFYLLPGDVLLDKLAKTPSDGMPLVLWGFEEDQTRKLVLQKDDETIEFPCP